MGDGKQLWHQKSAQGVLFGWQVADEVYPGCGSGKIYSLDKKTGKGAPSASATRA